MPFGTITSNSLNYEPRDEGHYVLSTLSFGDPDNAFIVRGAVPKADPLRCSVSRVFQKDIAVSGSTVRKTMTATLSIVVPSSSFTAAEVDNLVADISTFITAGTVTRMLMGEK